MSSAKQNDSAEHNLLGQLIALGPAHSARTGIEGHSHSIASVALLPPPPPPSSYRGRRGGGGRGATDRATTKQRETHLGTGRERRASGAGGGEGGMVSHCQCSRREEGLGRWSGSCRGQIERDSERDVSGCRGRSDEQARRGQIRRAGETKADQTSRRDEGARAKAKRKRAAWRTVLGASGRPCEQRATRSVESGKEVREGKGGRKRGGGECGGGGEVGGGGRWWLMGGDGGGRAQAVLARQPHGHVTIHSNRPPASGNRPKFSLSDVAIALTQGL